MLHQQPLNCFVLQAAKTYLERQFESFGGASLDDLVKHALHALQASLQVGAGIWSKSCLHCCVSWAQLGLPSSAHMQVHQFSPPGYVV